LRDAKRQFYQAENCDERALHLQILNASTVGESRIEFLDHRRVGVRCSCVHHDVDFVPFQRSEAPFVGAVKIGTFSSRSCHLAICR